MGDRRTGNIICDIYQFSIFLLHFESLGFSQTINEIEGAFDDYRKEVLDQLGEEVFNPSVIANKAIEQ